MKNVAIALVMLVGVPTVAMAQDDWESGYVEPPPAARSGNSGWNYDTALGARPLTMQKHMLRGTFRVNVGGSGIFGATGASIDMGTAFAVLDELEVGISSYRPATTTFPAQGLIPIVVAPDAAYGDIPLYGRYSFLEKDKLELAADLVLVLPANTDFALGLGVPLRFKIMDNLSLDSGVEFSLVASKPQVSFNFLFPVKVIFNITDEVFIHGSTGLGFTNLNNGNDVVLGLGAGGGYTLRVGDHILIDIFGEFSFAPLVDFTDGATPEAWIFAFGANVHTDPLF